MELVEIVVIPKLNFSHHLTAPMCNSKAIKLAASIRKPLQS